VLYKYYLSFSLKVLLFLLERRFGCESDFYWRSIELELTLYRCSNYLIK